MVWERRERKTNMSRASRTLGSGVSVKAITVNDRLGIGALDTNTRVA